MKKIKMFGIGATLLLILMVFGSISSAFCGTIDATESIEIKESLSEDDADKHSLDELHRSFNCEINPDYLCSYEKYITNRKHSSNSIKKIQEHGDKSDDPLLIIFINSFLYNQIEDEISVYISTLETVGYNVAALSISEMIIEELKEQILLYWDEGHNVSGVVLIGDLPTAWYYNEEDYFGPAEFPCDLFLMDLDGTWIDSDNDGLYDGHVDGEGDTAPEIYVGRIDASNIPGDEIIIIKKYLQKIHDFWMGNIPLSNNALTYTDHDWKNFGPIKHDIGFAYDDYEFICWPDVYRSDYLNNRLPNLYEFIQIATHSGGMSSSHNFHAGGRAYSNDIRTTAPKALFYNLYTCSALRFTEYDCLGNSYILDTNSPSLAVVGSTKIGSMLNFQNFYAPFGNGECFGNAFKIWFEQMAPFDDDDILWHYGMTILGDPTVTSVLPLRSNLHGPYAGIANEDIQFSGSAVGGKLPHSYYWDFGDGFNSTNQNPIHNYTETGEYTVTLTITDNGGNVVTDTTSVTIQTIIADAQGPYTKILGTSLQFNGFIAGGEGPYTWLWDFGDGNTSTEQNPVHNYNQKGTFTVILNVTDRNGNFDTDITTASVIFEVDAHGPYETILGETIQFTGSVKGGIGPLSWLWNFGDGNTSNEQNPSHKYSGTDEYTVSVSVCDSLGNNAISTVNAEFIMPVYVDARNTDGPWEGTLDYPYQLIQDGIDAVQDDCTVYVLNGTYNECVSIGKTVNLIGEHCETTIIDSEGVGIGISVGAPDGFLNGFTVKNSSIGISLYHTANQNVVTNTIITGTSEVGILLGGVYECTISQNLITNNGLDCEDSWCYTAISLDMGYIDFQKNKPSLYNRIIENTITNNRGNGIGIMTGCRHNKIYHNNFINNTIINAYDTNIDRDIDMNMNLWFDTEREYGNYWDNFDRHNDGAYDNDSDGVVDNPYRIPDSPDTSHSSNLDIYPLIVPWPNIPGDLDHDGDIDENDFEIFVTSIGYSEGDPDFNAECDYDGDGTITFVDYQIWLLYYQDFINPFEKNSGKIEELNIYKN